MKGKPKNESTGRANTVLVYQSGEGTKAIITPIVAKRRSSATPPHIRFTGPVVFAKKTAQHIQDVVWLVAEGLLTLLHIPICGYDLSVANLSAASAKDFGIDISGFSADLSVLMAILSAGAGASIESNIVYTGHIATTDGAIRMVGSVPEKITAVIHDPDTDTLIYPDPEGDCSMERLSPHEKEHITGAVCQSKHRLRLIAVGDVGDVIRNCFSEREILIAGLRHGFFGLSQQGSDSHTPIHRAARHLSHGLERRFWNQLLTDLTLGQSGAAIEVMAAWAVHFIQKQVYPPNAGHHLYGVVASIPQEIRRLKISFPLLPMSHCMQLCQWAGEAQSEDVWLFLKASQGDLFSSPLVSGAGDDEQTGAVKDPKSQLETIISAIDADNLTARITAKIDTALGSFPLESVTITSHEAFCHLIVSYFIHLYRHIHGLISTIDWEDAESEGLEILEEAFANHGGFKAALAEARNPVQGGMRYVLSHFTEHYKREQKEKYIRRVFKLALDPLELDGKIALMESVLKHLKGILPPEILAQPAARFADHYEPIVRSLVQSRDEITSIFRTL